LENKIARKQKELADEQKKVATEEEREFKKRQKENERRTSDYESRMSDINSTLISHERMHEETQKQIKRLQQLPDKIVVLFFAANPLDQMQLRLDEEVRSILEMIRKAKHRDVVKLESCWAVRPMDVLQALNEFQPAIVHFSGHGSSQDEIVFQDNNGNA
jgi:predicted patatin/cPLA2 family phospholipase